MCHKRFPRWRPSVEMGPPVECVPRRRSPHNTRRLMAPSNNSRDGWRPSPTSQNRPIARRRTISRRNRRCWARSWSTTTPSTASRISCAASISARKSTAAFSRSRVADPRRQARLADHHQDVSGRARRRRGQRAAISGAPRRRGDHRHQRQRLRTHRLRSGDPPRTDPIGEDTVNVAYDAPVDSSPREQIEEAERRLYQIAESGRYDGGFQRFSDALKIAVDMAAKAYERDGSLSGIATGLDRSRPLHGRPASFRPGDPGGTSGYGQDRAGHQYRVQHRQGASLANARRRHGRDGQRRHRRFLLARNVGRATGDAHHRRAVRRALLQDPPRRHFGTGLPPRRRSGARDAIGPVLHRPDRRHIDRPAHRAGAAPQTPARPRPAGRRLSSAFDRREAAATIACRNSPRSPWASRRSPRS